MGGVGVRACTWAPPVALIHPPPRMVTRELSRVCWLRRDQHNRQHMQSQEGEKSLSRAEHGPRRLSQKVCRNSANGDPLREREGNIIDICSVYRHNISAGWRSASHPSPMP